MFLNELMERADIYLLKSFIIDGSDYIGDIPKASYRERLEKADEEIMEFLASKCEAQEEKNKITDLFCCMTDVYWDIYVEVGMLAGIKLSLQLFSKIEDVTAPPPMRLQPPSREARKDRPGDG